jgi:hypothetical protein
MSDLSLGQGQLPAAVSFSEIKRGGPGRATARRGYDQGRPDWPALSCRERTSQPNPSYTPIRGLTGCGAVL